MNETSESSVVQPLVDFGKAGPNRIRNGDTEHSRIERRCRVLADALRRERKDHEK